MARIPVQLGGNTVQVQVQSSGFGAALSSSQTAVQAAADALAAQEQADAAALQADAALADAVAAKSDAETASSQASASLTALLAEKGQANGIATLDGGTMIPIAQVPVGTTEGTVAAGDDARIFGASQKAQNLSDLSDKEAANRTLGVFATRALAMAANIPVVLTTITLRGYVTAGDGGGALYKRVASEPSHAGKFQSADGQWWEIAEATVTPAMVGDDLVALMALPATDIFIPYRATPYGISASIKPKSGARIRSNGATIKVAPGSGSTVSAFRFDSGVNDVEFGGFVVDGNRDNQSISGDGAMHGLDFRECSNIRGNDVKLVNCMTDGVYLGRESGSDANPASDGVSLTRVRTANSRRNGMSITKGRNGYFLKCAFNEANGIAPEAGVDIEPNTAGDLIENMIFDDCEGVGNAYRGFMIDNKGGTISGVKLRKFNLESGYGSTSGGIKGCAFRLGGSVGSTTTDILLEDNTYSGDAPTDGSGMIDLGISGATISKLTSRGDTVHGTVRMAYLTDFLLDKMTVDRSGLTSGSSVALTSNVTDGRIRALDVTGGQDGLDIGTTGACSDISVEDPKIKSNSRYNINLRTNASDIRAKSGRLDAATTACVQLAGPNCTVDGVKMSNAATGVNIASAATNGLVQRNAIDTATVTTPVTNGSATAVVTGNVHQRLTGSSSSGVGSGVFAAHSATTVAVPVTGAVTGDRVLSVVPTGLPAGMTWSAVFVTNGQCDVTIVNPTAADKTRAAFSLKVTGEKAV